MTETLPESALLQHPWHRKRTWRGSTRFLSTFLIFSFTATQIFTPLAFAEHDQLPSWLKEEAGGWVSADQAQRMHRANQDLLAHLAALENAKQRYITTHPSGLQAQYASQELVVARDLAGNLLWSPTLDDYQRLWNGTLLLVDGTLQTVREGRLVRQVTVDGTETFFRADGRAEYEIATDGTRTDYAYTDSADGKGHAVSELYWAYLGRKAQDWEEPQLLEDFREVNSTAALMR